MPKLREGAGMLSERWRAAITAVNDDPAVGVADLARVRRRLRQRRARARSIAAVVAAMLVVGGLALARRPNGGTGVAPVPAASSVATSGPGTATTTGTPRRSVTYTWKEAQLVLVDNAPDAHASEQPPAVVPKDCLGQPQTPTVMRATVAKVTSALSPPTVSTGQEVWAVVCTDMPRAAAGEAAGTMPELVPNGDLIRLFASDGTWLFTTHTPPASVTSYGASVATSQASVAPAPSSTAASTTASTIGEPRTAAVTASRPPLPPGQFVAWRRSGELVVLDASTGAVVRQLAQIRVAYPATGPSGVVLTPDRRMAVVSWNEGEFCGAQRVGAVPTDGSAALVLWGPGDQPVVSPDGQRAAWTAIDVDCYHRSLVVHDVGSGAEHSIALADDEASASALRATGPWWQSDDNTLVYAQMPPDPSSEYSSTALTFDASRATKRSDASPLRLGCVTPGMDPVFARQTPTGDGLVLARSDPSGGATAIVRCRFGADEGEVLLTTDLAVLVAQFDRDAATLLLLTWDGAVGMAAPGGVARVVAMGPFQSVAW